MAPLLIVCAAFRQVCRSCWCDFAMHASETDIELVCLARYSIGARPKVRDVSRLLSR